MQGCFIIGQKFVTYMDVAVSFLYPSSEGQKTSYRGRVFVLCFVLGNPYNITFENLKTFEVCKDAQRRIIEIGLVKNLSASMACRLITNPMPDLGTQNSYH